MNNGDRVNIVGYVTQDGIHMDDLNVLPGVIDEAMPGQSDLYDVRLDEPVNGFDKLLLFAHEFEVI